MSAKSVADALRLEGLDVACSVGRGERLVLRGLDLKIGPGEAFGLLGEPGSGKTTAALAIMGALPRGCRVTGGRILLAGRDIASMSDPDLSGLREREVSMAPAEAGQALNPSLPCGMQLVETFQLLGSAESKAPRQALELLRRLGIEQPERVMGLYPGALTADARQRVIIALALIGPRKLIVLDEPTFGLGLIEAAATLEAIQAWRVEQAGALLVLGRDPDLMLGTCARVGVLYAGRLVEEGPTAQVLGDPRHPYTVALTRCLPGRNGRREARLGTVPGLPPASPTDVSGCLFHPRCGLAEDICRTSEPPLIALPGGRVSRCHFHERAPSLPEPPREPHPTGPASGQGSRPVGEKIRTAPTRGDPHPGVRDMSLRDMALQLRAGETLGVVGEAKALGGLLDDLLAEPIQGIGHAGVVPHQSDGPLNRAYRIRRILGRAVERSSGLRGQAARERLAALARDTGLSDRDLGATPPDLSEETRRRAAIALAFTASPKLVALDDPTRGLGISAQAAILNLLADLQARTGASYLLLSYDLRALRYLSDRVAIPYLGRLVEVGPADRIFRRPHHPYTEALLAATMGMGGKRRPVHLRGGPDPAAPRSGCVFQKRCHRHIGPLCDTDGPALSERDEGHAIRCHLALVELEREPEEPTSLLKPASILEE